jgi:hypothetical protein
MVEKHAIVIIYHGTEPNREAVEKAIEALIQHGVSMDTLTVSPYVLNEKDIAMAITGFCMKQEAIETTPTFDDLCKDMCTDIAKDTRIESVVNKYVLSRIGCINNAFSRNVNSVVEISKGSRLPTIKAVKKHCNISVKEAIDIVNALYDIVQKCQGHIVE